MLLIAGIRPEQNQTRRHIGFSVVVAEGVDIGRSTQGSGFRANGVRGLDLAALIKVEIGDLLAGMANGRATQSPVRSRGLPKSEN
jgi:hypothetical protein